MVEVKGVNGEMFTVADGVVSNPSTGVTYEIFGEEGGNSGAGETSELVYKCTGTNDNVQLSNICAEFFADSSISDMAQKIIYVNGDIGITNEPIAGTGAGTWQDATDPFRFFNFSVGGYAATGKKRITFDFGNATFPQKIYNPEAGNYLIALFCLNSTKITIKNATINLEPGEVPYGYSENNHSGFCGTGRFVNCVSNCKSIQTAYGFFGSGIFLDCEANCGSWQGINGNTWESVSGGYGFFVKNATCTRCKAKVLSFADVASVSGFWAIDSVCIDCTGVCEGTDYAVGMNGTGSTFINCIGRANGLQSGAGLNVNNSSLYKCMGIGTVWDMYGITVINSTLIDCTGIGGENAGIFAQAAADGTTTLLGCTAPLGTNPSYYINPANASGIVAYISGTSGLCIQGCRVHSGFGTKISPISNVTDRVIVSNNILNVPITQAFTL